MDEKLRKLESEGKIKKQKAGMVQIEEALRRFLRPIKRTPCAGEGNVHTFNSG